MYNRDTTWVGVEDDKTIPQNDEERGYWVLRLLLAMQNRDNVLDRRTTKQWGSKEKDQYSEDQMESVCWNIVDTAERLHTQGLNIFPIYSKKAVSQAVSEQELTFAERIETLIELLCFFKARCDAFMKGVGNEEIIANPRSKLRSSIENRKLNDNRANEKTMTRKKLGIITKGKGKGKSKATVDDADEDIDEDADENVETSDDNKDHNDDWELDDNPVAPREASVAFPRSSTLTNCMSLSSDDSARDEFFRVSPLNGTNKPPEASSKQTLSQNNTATDGTKRNFSLGASESVAKRQHNSTEQG